MRWSWGFFIGLALALLAPVSMRAAELRASTPELRKEVIAVIEAQLAAFREGDPTTAWSYASRELRAARPLRVFTFLVRDNYPEIWANTRAEYGIVHDDGSRATLAVHVYAGEKGAAYNFTLVKERAGWRVLSVLRAPPQQKGKV